jgi:hypothetical protein
MREDPLEAPAVVFHQAPKTAAFVEPQQIQRDEIKRPAVVAAAWHKNEAQETGTDETPTIDSIKSTGAVGAARSEAFPGRAESFQALERSAVEPPRTPVAAAWEPAPAITPRPAAVRTEKRSDEPATHVTTNAFPRHGESIETIEEETPELAEYSPVAWTPAARADIDPDYEPVGAVEAAPAAKKPVLPAPSGALPKPGSKLPPLVTATAVGGMSLQEALQAARELQR